MDTFVLLPPQGADPEKIERDLEWFVDRNPDVPMTVVVDEPPTTILAVIVLGDGPDADFRVPSDWSI